MSFYVPQKSLKSNHPVSTEDCLLSQGNNSCRKYALQRRHIWMLGRWDGGLQVSCPNVDYALSCSASPVHEIIREMKQL